MMAEEIDALVVSSGFPRKPSHPLEQPPKEVKDL